MTLLTSYFSNYSDNADIVIYLMVILKNQQNNIRKMYTKISPI